MTPIRLDIGVRLLASLDSAEAIRAGRQRQRKILARMRRYLSLKLDMRRCTLSEQTQLTFGQRAKPPLRVESKLNVACEVAPVIDVAGSAVRVPGQLMQLLDARFRAATARTEQIPPHRQDAEPLRREEEFHNIRRRGVPLSRHRQRTNAAESHRRRVEQKVGKLRRQAVTRRIAPKLCDQPIEAPTGRRLDRIFGAGAKNFVGCRGLGDQPFDGGEPFVRLALKLAGHLGQPAQNADALDLARKDEPGAGTFRFELKDRVRTAEWAVEKIAGLAEPAVFLPLAVAFLPLQSKRPKLDRSQTVDASLGIGALFNHVTWRTRQFVEASGVCDERPNRLGGAGEVPFLAEATDGFHCPFLKFVSRRIRSQPMAVVRPLYEREGIRFRDFSRPVFVNILPAFASGHCARRAAPTKGETVI